VIDVNVIVFYDRPQIVVGVTLLSKTSYDPT
jgi:hypothetical protein